jgi:hypothetical protein
MLGIPGNSTAKQTQWKIQFAQVTDGLSNTICFAELAGKQKLFFRGQQVPWPQVLGQGLVLNSYYGDENIARHVRGYTPWPTVPATPANPPNGCASINVINENSIYSFHVGGAHVVMGDGSVRFISENISALILVALITRDGGEARSLD